MTEPPQALFDADLIKVCRPDCRSHEECESPGKRPVESVYATKPVGEIREWVDACGNVGVVPSGDLVVIDIDDMDAAPVVGDVIGIETFVVRTGSGGAHVYLRCPEWDENRTITGPDGEIASVRADGWMVVAPPSIHPGTRERYRVLVDAEIARVGPGAVAEFCERAAPPPTPASSRRSSSGGGRERSERPPTPARTDDRLAEVVNHDERRRELAEILAESDPAHNRRLYLAGFLADACGLSAAEICRLIGRYNCWVDYDPEVTRRQVESVVGGGDRR